MRFLKPIPHSLVIAYMEAYDKTNNGGNGTNEKTNYIHIIYVLVLLNFRS